MQTASGFAPPAPHLPYPYHGHIHGGLPQQDHDLKRQYLALLPPPQIIEICLIFDLHVPPYIKSSIWPSDLNAAIAAIKSAVPPPETDSSTEKNLAPEVANGVASSPNPPNYQNGSPALHELDPSEKQPPDKSTATPPRNTPGSTTESTNPSTPAHSSAYPYAGYPYPPPPTGAYPHNPYYAPPHGFSPYAPYAYPPPPAPPTGMYPNPQGPPQESQDDLPSYEEMIVEALHDSTDPEGCAPKDLFAWMASRYPLQSNFRPSASQALQKAFKRGRLEKSTGGKYRISATWEGGNTSRRTTRRPQTQSHVPNSHVTPASPFTHAPLHQPTPPGYGYAYPPPPLGYGYSAPHPHTNSPQQSVPSQSQPTPAAPSEHSNSLEATSSEVYEAAQNILKAINFGNLLRLSEAAEQNLANHVNANASTSTLLNGSDATINPPGLPPAENSIPFGSLTVAHLMPHAPQPQLAPMASLMPSIESPSDGSRAELQAQLVLLAAQLADLGQMDSEPEASLPSMVSTHPPPAAQSIQAPILAPAFALPLPPLPQPVQSLGVKNGGQQVEKPPDDSALTDTDDEEMVEII
ncbi:hypothetical protein BDN72DRAFT_876614 [Pluteus cervinus]|uniref:Uncharacterized protein n=1 Tax=Pluteus cervinus TaxID=181527 RepID=A0ACD3B3G7_9AGAR|nr:hypothetical protein BDN72DRAFT_876614 [Pluteus cervinus]